MYASLPLQESPIRVGLSFSPSYRLFLTGRHYVIPFILREEDALAPLIQAVNLTNSLSWNVNHMSIDYPVISSIKNTLRSFDKEFHVLLHNLKDFLRYVVNTDPTKSHFNYYRKKRGLVNAIGSISNVLFGTATQAQVDAIHDELETLNSFTEKERVLLNVHSTTLNLTLRNMNAMQSALNRLSSAVNVSHQVLRQFSIKTLHIEQEQKLLQSLIDLEFALTHISSDILDLKIGLQALLQTYITPQIVNDSTLLHILQEASHRPPGLLFQG